MSRPDRHPRTARHCCARSSSAAAWTPSPNASRSPHTGGLGHAEFLELVLADEVTRRETSSAAAACPRRRARPGDDPGPLGRHRQDHLRPRHLERAVVAALRRVRPQRRRSWDPSASARPSSPPPSATPPSAAASPSTSNAATGSSNGSAPAGSTTATTPRCANSCASTCLIIDDFALQALDAARHRRHLRAHRRTAPRRSHGRHLEPGTDRVARPHGRPTARPIRHRPAPIRRPRTRPRRRVLPPTPTTRPSPPTTPLTNHAPRRDHHDADADTPRSGPITLAHGWSHQAGGRHAWSHGRDVRLSIPSAMAGLWCGRGLRRSTDRPTTEWSSCSPSISVCGVAKSRSSAAIAPGPRRCESPAPQRSKRDHRHSVGQRT